MRENNEINTYLPKMKGYFSQPGNPVY